MADRTTRVTLVANVTGYISGMDQATRRTRELGTAAEKLAQQRQGFDVLGRSMLAVGALAAAGVGLAVKQFADFDAKLSQVQSLSHATADEMDQLRVAALHMGQAIGQSAGDVADAEIELVKAGISVKDILGGALQGALLAAAAGQIEVGQATEIATIAMTQFGLAGKDIPHVADLLAAGADKALGGVGDLGEALKSGGLVAAQFGVSLDETVGTLAAFANAGLIGEVAGTDLRQMLLKLAAPAADARDTMKKLGLSIYDQSGAFVGITDLAGQLQQKLSKLTPEQRNAALATIFGARAIAGANVLYKEGAAGIAKWTQEVNDSGFAAKQAAGKMDNLKGDLSKLEAAFNTALIESGSSANGVLRELTQTVTFLISGFGELPQPALAAGLALTGVVAAVALTGGTALIAVPRIAAFNEAMLLMGRSGKIASVGIGIAGVAVATATIIFSYFAQKAADQKGRVDALTDSFNKSTGAVTEYSRELIKKDLLESKYIFVAQKLGISYDELTDYILGNKDAITSVNATLDEFSATSQIAATWVQDLKGQLGSQTEEVGKATDNFHALQSETDKNTDSLTELSGAAVSATGDIDELAKTIKSFGSAQLDVNSAERDFQAAIDDLTASVKENGQTLDITTDAGRKNSAALDDIASSATSAASAILTQTGSQEDATAAVQAGRDAYIAAAAQLGIGAEQAGVMADALGLIPANVSTAVKLTGIDTALNALKNLYGQSVKLANVPHYEGSIGIGINENGGLYNRGVKAFENGGFPSGIYAGRSGGIHKFAEGNLPWETYISPKPGARAQNLNIWAETGKRLGAFSGARSAGSNAGPVTALVDPSLIRAIRELATAHQTTLSTIGLAEAAGQGRGRKASAGG